MYLSTRFIKYLSKVLKYSGVGREGGTEGTFPTGNPENFQRMGIKHWVIQQN